jgi:hypothetical protein
MDQQVSEVNRVNPNSSARVIEFKALVVCRLDSSKDAIGTRTVMSPDPIFAAP